MRKILLSTVALLAMAGAASAADLPSTKAAPVYVPPPPVFTWTGFYIGIEGGGDFRNYHDNWTGRGINKDGGLIGGVLGYNWQMGNFVVGLEGDAAALLSGNEAWTYNGVQLFNNTLNGDYAAAIRGRIGIPAFERALFYVAGGVAFGDVKYNYYAPALGYGVSATQDRVGWTIGAGMDYAFTPNWIARIEYRYVDLGNGDNYNFAYGGVNYWSNNRLNVTSNQVMGAIMYKFGEPVAAPVVAKY
jgi:outer membrane immunogenic protein